MRPLLRTVHLASRLAIVLALVTAARVAIAGDVVKARQVFAEGVRLYQAGDWEGARRLFRDADAEHHAPAIVYNIGLAEEKLGHPQAAVDAYESYIAEAGEKGELVTAAASAIAQVKARSTRLRIDTKPPGARVFLDGNALVEAAPATVLVGPGHHVVVAQGDGWRAERDVETRGAGDTLGALLEAPAPATTGPSTAPVPLRDATPPPPPPIDAPRVDLTQGPPPTAEHAGADGLTWGASFAIAPAYLLGVTDAAAPNARGALSIVAGPLLEVGYALTDRAVFLGRGFAAIGPDAKPSYAYMGGPGLAFKVGSSIWLGGSFIGGRLETRAHDTAYGTDLVFGTILEASIVLIEKPSGEWIAGVQPSLLLTELRRDNTTFFVPLSFGFRAY